MKGKIHYDFRVENLGQVLQNPSSSMKTYLCLFEIQIELGTLFWFLLTLAALIPALPFPRGPGSRKKQGGEVVWVWATGGHSNPSSSPYS